jgi:hypothetical protein
MSTWSALARRIMTERVGLADPDSRWANVGRGMPANLASWAWLNCRELRYSRTFNARYDDVLSITIFYYHMVSKLSTMFIYQHFRQRAGHRPDWIEVSRETSSSHH